MFNIKNFWRFWRANSTCLLWKANSEKTKPKKTSLSFSWYLKRPFLINDNVKNGPGNLNYWETLPLQLITNQFTIQQVLHKIQIFMVIFQPPPPQDYQCVNGLSINFPIVRLKDKMQMFSPSHFTGHPYTYEIFFFFYVGYRMTPN